ncbi:protein LTV1 homolog [Toxorhynchites rutilus septentrionalis]|uniref:protein LTV1 homolog n=1 Tax=Toxorhynchites rutilus septentrionalis TaxID=329112 RepID=UPI002479E7BD|nr:protein LTV1 homolog [Toxorhynchites rutilus septentrionalis]
MVKKKFIDKKKAVTFRLVNRSQQDPLFVDENAPQHVLVPVSAPGKDDPRASGAASRASTSAGQVDPTKRRDVQAKFGIYFDDDYDYLQHLREPGRNEVYWEPVQPTKTAGAEKVSIKLPSSVFASEVEEEEGLMKKKAQQRPGPRPDWDPDVVAALDDDFDYEDPENQLDDDFMDQAMGGDADGDDYFDEEDECSDVDSNEAGMYDDEERDGLGPLDFDREETKSRFTEYSISSSVIRRNEQLSLLDDRFEKFYEQYNDPELGALECEDIEGHIDIDDDVLLQYAEKYRKERDEKYDVAYDKQWDKERILQLQEVSSDEEEMVEMVVEDETQKKWDCESILSTNTNIYNHPKLIEEPRKQKVAKISINPRTGLPMNVLGADSGKLTVKSLAKLNQEESTLKASGPRSLCEGSVISTLSVLSIRPKDETQGEKRERKKLLKEYRAERRIERKANTDAFKEVKKQQEKAQVNKRANAGVKIV